jgi:hypothetical protein
LGKKTGSKILNIDNKEQMKLNTTRIIEWVGEILKLRNAFWEDVGVLEPFKSNNIYIYIRNYRKPLKFFSINKKSSWISVLRATKQENKILWNARLISSHEHSIRN